MAQTKKKTNKTSTISFYRKPIFLWWAGGILGFIILIALWFRVSSWPGAMVIRYEFNKGGRQTTQRMEPYAPKYGINVIHDQKYRTHDKDATLDVYTPDDAVKANQKLPVIIWTHGGAWLSGDKKAGAPYYKLLAQKGFTVIALDYSLAPDKKYPTALYQINDAYKYINLNAARFHADTDKIVLAGDSAGSQLSAQMAALITSPMYAKEVGITPNLAPTQLKGVVLNCGIYMMERLAYPNPSLSKLIGWGDDVTVWAYSGTHDFSDPIIRQMSPYYHVTKDFPATYITGGNADPLSDAQSKPFASKLQSLGVAVTTLFYPENHEPELPHEYQFNLDTNDAQHALDMTVDFARQQTD